MADDATIPLISVSNLVFEYRDKRAIDNASFAIPQGSVVALVGPNGAGKTTLLRSLAALDEPVSGKILLDGIDIEDNPRAAHARIGFLQDFFGVHDGLTVLQNVQHAAAIMGIPYQHIADATAKAIAAVNLGAHLTRKGSELSRGLRQRLAIARAIIHRPKLLLMDEPASGLDPEARRELSQLIRSLHAGGATIVVSSHILTELQDYSTHMLAMRDGRITGPTPLGAASPATGRRLRLACNDKLEQAEAFLREMPQISCLAAGDSEIAFDYSGSGDEQAALLAGLVHSGIAVREFHEARENLEQLYFAEQRR